MDTQVNAHLKSLAVFRTGAQQVEDTALQSYARTLLPTIGEHLEMARTMVEGEGAAP
jgi:predicted outer membrane protein